MSTTGVSPRPGPSDEQSPDAETVAQRRAVQTVAVAALLVSAVYLTWRALYTMGVWWASIPMLVLEIHAAIGLGLFTFSLWELRTTPRIVPPDAPSIDGSGDQPDRRVAVLITTYDEPQEVLLPTLAAAVALAEPHRTLVLDDGDRPWVGDLCDRLGAQHVTRPDNSHAKAGNLNHAIEMLRDSVDIVAVLDADHVPTVDFLADTLDYFDDPDVALVQTPQDFYNAGSFEHDANRSLFWSSRRSARYNEQGLFYRGIQAGKNRWNASFWCGTNALLRVEALRSVGGVATDSLTEDIHTTLRLHRLGWKTVYHNEPLARGLAARNAAEYQIQRYRWGTGAMQLIRRERPFTAPGLTLAQRVSYAATLLGWFDAWRTLGYLLLPIVTLATGELPIRTDFLIFAIAYLATSLLQRIAMSLLSRGLAPQGVAIVFEVIRLPVNLRATLGLVRRSGGAFQVTPKGSSDRARIPVPRLITVLIGANVVALCWFGATMLGSTPLEYEEPWAAVATAGFAWFNLTILVTAAQRIRSARFAGSRRRGERFRLGMGAQLDDHRVELVDVSLTGASVVVPGDPPPEPTKLRLELDGGVATLAVVERSRRSISPDGTVQIGLEFDQPTSHQLAFLSRTLFGHDADPVLRSVDRAPTTTRPEIGPHELDEVDPGDRVDPGHRHDTGGRRPSAPCVSDAFAKPVGDLQRRLGREAGDHGRSHR